MSNRTIYLDHAATTPTDEEVLREMLPYFSDAFGNASSPHREGRRAVATVDAAREKVAQAIGASPAEIYFTSGGTESDNWAITGVAEAYREKGRHILSSAIEHPAVLKALSRLESRGYEVTYLPVDREGYVSVERAIRAMRNDTVLVTIMTANNEVGSIQPIREIFSAAHERGIVTHTDAVQAIGAIPIDVKALGADLLSLSAHKFYGPKGVGALYLRKGIKIKGLIVGGEQERSLRAGTYNTPAIVGLGAAIERATASLEENAARLLDLKTRFITGLKEIPFTAVNGGSNALAGTVNVTFSGVRNSELLFALDREGIAASSGSACSSGSIEPSHVLTAMGLTKEEVGSSVRFSFGKENTVEDVTATLDAIKGILSRLREGKDLFLQKKSNRYEG
ncbi:MAG: cysteine desulfurase [Clostridia bacterium]|nr:cysteine desulfurase [Clostridia bacterium]